MPCDQENQEKLDYAARLSGLLLNEGTDVMRWFLMDNLPRTSNNKPNLRKLLIENRKIFETLLDGEEVYFAHEMFDILFPPLMLEIDEANMEISLLFILIRFLCKIKHTTWKWWEEDPQPHQRMPLFDVIRLARFQTSMQSIVHNYEITKEKYERSLKYLINLIERLKGYKISARRWESDVISYEEDESVTKQRKTIDFVTIMRWQTLPINQRNATYLVHKKNFFNTEEKRDGKWPAFISCFGQMRSFAICDVNELLEDIDERRTTVVKANNTVHRSYLGVPQTPAITLNWHLVHDKVWKRKIQEYSADSLTRCSSHGPVAKQSVDLSPSSLTYLEKQIYCSVDDRVFITDSPSDTPWVTKICEGWKNQVVKNYSSVRIFPYQKHDEIQMDGVKLNMTAPNGVALTNWSDAFGDSAESAVNPLRIVISGPLCYGKTTALQKIAYSCATKNCPRLQQYDVIFFINLSNLKLEKPFTRVVDCIKRQCFTEDKDFNVTSDTLQEFLETRDGEGVLFLFDNFEDFPISEETSEICDVIRSHLWPKCGIILTKCISSYYQTSIKLKDLLNESKITWRHFHTDGFRLCDVVEEVRRYFSKKSETSDIDVARHLINLMRIYQRDIYTGQTASPVLTSIICKAWSEISKKKDANNVKTLPETLEHILEFTFLRYFREDSSDISEFEREVTVSTLANTTNKFQSRTYDERLEMLMKIGVIRDVSNAKGKQVKTLQFAHPLLQDYFSAKIYCSKKSDFCLKNYLITAADALQLQHFITCCCEIDVDASEYILDILSELVQTGGNATDQLLQLSFRCFYVSGLSGSSKAHSKITSSIEKITSTMTNSEQYGFGPDSFHDDGRSDLTTAELELTQPHKLSHKTRQSLLKFTAACRPYLTNSGTVLPLLCTLQEPHATSYIRSLHISQIRQSQVVFTASIISRLPFLDSISLTEIERIATEDFETICNSLKPTTKDVASPLHFLKITFKVDTPFDLVHVPTYEALGSVLRELPFLESLNVDPFTYRHFMSIYDDSKMTVPLENIQLPRCNISEQQCKKMMGHLRRTIFARNLNFSHNPFHGGMSDSRDTLAQFRALKTVNFEQCCLDALSLTSLSSCFDAPRLSRTITSVNLRANHIDDQGALLGLAASLGHLRALQSLDLSQNFLRDRVVCVLAAQFHRMKNLRRLQLDYVEMGELGFSALRSNISCMEKLEVLSLGENPLQFDALKLLSFLNDADAKVRRSLVKLKISGISNDTPLQVSPKGVKEATHALSSFTNLRVLDLTNTCLTYSDAVRILQVAEDHPSLAELRLSKRLVPLTEDEKATWSCLRV